MSRWQGGALAGLALYGGYVAGMRWQWGAVCVVLGLLFAAAVFFPPTGGGPNAPVGRAA